MSDLNAKAYALIDNIEASYQNMLERLSQYASVIQQEKSTVHYLEEQLDHAHNQITILKEQEQIWIDQKKELESELNNLKADTKSTPSPHIETTEPIHGDTHLNERIAQLEAQNTSLEEKYHSTYQLLQKEMVKVDTMQMELELAQRERDVALRKQSMTPDQKKLLIKLEHENYRINEAIERIDYISNSLRSILDPDAHKKSDLKDYITKDPIKVSQP